MKLTLLRHFWGLRAKRYMIYKYFSAAMFWSYLVKLLFNYFSNYVICDIPLLMCTLINVFKKFLCWENGVLQTWLVSDWFLCELVRPVRLRGFRPVVMLHLRLCDWVSVGFSFWFVAWCLSRYRLWELCMGIGFDWWNYKGFEFSFDGVGRLVVVCCLWVFWWLDFVCELFVRFCLGFFDLQVKLLWVSARNWSPSIMYLQVYLYQRISG